MSPMRLLSAALVLAPAAVLAAPTTYVIDPTHTTVLASWDHLGFSRPSAHFGNATGTLVHDPEDLSASSVEVTLPLSGMDGFSADFNQHLRSADLFEAERYPTITFRSTSVEAAGEGRMKVTGELTVKDTTRTVVLDARLNRAAEHPMLKRPAIGFDATATIRRSEFGIAYAVPAVSDEVELRITTEAVVAAD